MSEKWQELVHIEDYLQKKENQAKISKKDVNLFPNAGYISGYGRTFCNSLVLSLNARLHQPVKWWAMSIKGKVGRKVDPQANLGRTSNTRRPHALLGLSETG